jgi:CheY-like chemotaxis protein
MIPSTVTHDNNEHRRIFERQLRDALAKFYDRTYLETSPLAAAVGLRGSADEPQSTALRRYLRDAIESLKPEPTIPYGQPEWLGYQLLWLRYIHRKSIPHVCDELGIGRSSYYRYHQQALQALSSLLWNQMELARETYAGVAGTSTASIARGQGITEAMDLAYQSPWQDVDLSQLLASVLQTVQPLCKADGITFSLVSPPSPTVLYGDPALMRQALISLLSDYIECLESRCLRLVVEPQEHKMIWSLQGRVSPGCSEEALQRMSGYRLAQELITFYGGQLWIRRRGQALFPTFTLPIRAPQTILIVDDDWDTIRLYQRWLQVGRYQTRTARRNQELEDILSQTRPDLILLDVLMPQWDGWSVLQRLKGSPETKEIPVVICSVLSQPRLADALGAAAVLRKPIDQGVFMTTVRHLLGRSDSLPSGNPAEREGSGYLL